MPKKDATGPKGHGLKDGHGKGQGPGQSPGKGPGQDLKDIMGNSNGRFFGQGPMTGGKKGVKGKPQK